MRQKRLQYYKCVLFLRTVLKVYERIQEVKSTPLIEPTPDETRTRKETEEAHNKQYVVAEKEANTAFADLDKAFDKLFWKKNGNL